jgi:hypothetical protein
MISVIWKKIYTNWVTSLACGSNRRL